MSRTGDRSKYPVDFRVDLLERDVDELEEKYEKLSNDMRTARAVQVGMMITITTGSVMLALNLVLKAIGG